MKYVAPDDFHEVAFTEGWAPRMKMHVYDGAVFDCACGQRHVFKSGEIAVARELSGMKVVLECPRGLGVVLVEIKGLLGGKFKSLLGAQSSLHPAPVPVVDLPDRHFEVWRHPGSGQVAAVEQRVVRIGAILGPLILFPLKAPVVVPLVLLAIVFAPMVIWGVGRWTIAWAVVLWIVNGSAATAVQSVRLRKMGFTRVGLLQAGSSRKAIDKAEARGML